jgi:hypothetical protein
MISEDTYQEESLDEQIFKLNPSWLGSNGGGRIVLLKGARCQSMPARV